MLNYTKGEWQITDYEANTDKGESIRIGCINESVLGIKANKHIAFADNYANAHLIAAAPDMYEALKELSYYHPKQGYEQWLILLNRANRAITKAEGINDREYS